MDSGAQDFDKTLMLEVEMHVSWGEAKYIGFSKIKTFHVGCFEKG